MSQGKLHAPTDEQRRSVEMMRAYGIPEADIARVLEITVATLLKYYRYELDTGHVTANSKVAKSLFEKALGNGNGAVAAAIFWLKCRAGWQEPMHPPGKKELQQQVAETATRGTEWAGDLEAESRIN